MLICSLILTLLAAMPFGQEATGMRVKISLFDVPSMIVSYTVAGWSTPDGGVAGTTVGGDITGSFPDHPVTLENRLAAGSLAVDIKTIIRDFMANACLRAQDIPVHELAGHELVFAEPAEAGQEVYQELEEGLPSPSSIRVDIEPAWETDEETGLSLRVWLRWQDPYGIQEISGNIPERLAVEQTVPVKFGLISLVGFPSSTSGRRFIYWLALSAERT